MKKIMTLVFVFTLLSSALTIPAFAENQNYQANAATTENNDMDWNWLGLLGLAGLLGLRGRNRERT